MNEVLEGVLTAALPLITAIFGALALMIRQWIKARNAEVEARIGSSNYHLATNLARNVVQAVEQTALPDMTGEQKKAAAMRWARELLTELELACSDELLDKLIEAVVLGLKVPTSQVTHCLSCSNPAGLTE